MAFFSGFCRGGRIGNEYRYQLNTYQLNKIRATSQDVEASYSEPLLPGALIKTHESQEKRAPRKPQTIPTGLSLNRKSDDFRAPPVITKAIHCGKASPVRPVAAILGSAQLLPHARNEGVDTAPEHPQCTDHPAAAVVVSSANGHCYCAPG